VAVAALPPTTAGEKNGTPFDPGKIALAFSLLLGAFQAYDRIQSPAVDITTLRATVNQHGEQITDIKGDVERMTTNLTTRMDSLQQGQNNASRDWADLKGQIADLKVMLVSRGVTR
jgi:hypothetical protein